MYFRTRRHNLIQQSDDMIALRLRYAHNLRHEPWVEEDTLPACDGVGSDKWVFGDDWISSNGAAELACALSLHLGGV